MNSTNVEQKLAKLSQAWPGVSVADAVSATLAETSDTELAEVGKQTWKSRVFSYLWLEVAVAIVLVAVLFIPRNTTVNESPARDSNADAIAEFDQSFAFQDVDPSIDVTKLIDLPAKATGLVVDSDGNPVVGADVSVRVRRYSSSVGERELVPLGPWTAKTDSQGKYQVEPKGKVIAKNCEIRMWVSADGFADMNAYDHNNSLKTGTLSTTTLYPGRKIDGQIVSPDGQPVPKSIVRFFAGNEDVIAWDSGPFPVDDEGRYSISVLADATVVGTVYPRGYAPRLLDVSESVDQGPTKVKQGVSLTGRAVDRAGNGIADSVVSFRSHDVRVTGTYRTAMGRSVRTNQSGHFKLPPLTGKYLLSVVGSGPDFATQSMLVGPKPPAIVPVTIDFDQNADGELLLKAE